MGRVEKFHIQNILQGAYTIYLPIDQSNNNIEIWERCDEVKKIKLAGQTGSVAVLFQQYFPSEI